MKQIRFLIQSALVFFIIATMVSCQPEDFNKELQTITTDTFIVTEKKLQDLKNDPLFSPVYSKIVKEESSFSNNTLFRTMIPTDNGYILISDSKVKVSEFSGITSYTFPIKNISLDSLSFQNLIVNKFPGQEFRYYIATYTPTEESEETHFGEESFEGEKNIVEITIEEGYFPITSQQRSGGYSPCNLTVLKWCDNDGSGGYGATHPAGENCTSHNHTWYELVQSGDCSSQNSYVSQVQDLIDNIVSAGGGGNGGGSPQNPNNPISNNPVPVNPENPTTPGFSDGDGFIITTPIKPLDAITAQSTFFDVLSTNVNYRNWWNHEQNWLATDFIMSIFTVNNNTNSNIRNINKAAAFAESLVGFCVNNNQPLYGTSALINIISQILQSDNYSPVNLTPEQKGLLNDSQNQELALHIYSYLAINGLNPTLYNSPKTFNQESWEFAQWATTFFINNPDTTWGQFENWFMGTVDLDNNSIGGYDNTTYQMVNPNNLQQDWPTIESVIPLSDFVGFRDELTSDGTRYLSCMDFAKEQIAKKGYSISNYDAPGQTFQVYTESNGVDVNALWEGISYLKYALSNGIPVIVGVDNKSGSPNPHTDNTTDHFIVIVGTGVNFQGEIYFRFFDNATSYSSQGASPYNMLFLDTIINMIVGQTEVTEYRDNLTEYDYRVTQIRKSK